MISPLAFTGHVKVEQELAQTLKKDCSLYLKYNDNYFKELFREFLVSDYRAFVNPRFNLNNFPINGYFLDKTLEINVNVFSFGKISLAIAKKKMLEAGYRPALPIELLAFVLKLNLSEKRNFMITSVDPIMEDSSSNRFFSYFRQMGDEKRISLAFEKAGLPEHAFILGVKL